MDRFQHLRGVSFGLHFFEDLLDLPVSADQKSAAFDAHVLLPVHALLFPHSVRFGDLVIGIGHEGVGESVLGGKFFLRLGFVRGNTDDLRTGLGKLPGCVAKLARLFRSTGSIRLRIEEHHNAFALQLRKLESVNINLRRAIARFESHTPEIVN